MRTEVGHGSYALVFDIEVPVENRLGCFQGRYCYVGSAFGPGGIEARVSRHLRPRKPVQWHIDVLTTSPHFRPIAAYATGESVECRLARAISEILGGHPGFGASDCRCPTHLFRVDSMTRLERVLSGAGMVRLDLADYLP